MNRRLRQLLLAASAGVLLLLAAAGTWQATRPAGPVTAQQRAATVEQTLRCPTCQGLSIADSPSPIAAGMRQQVERQLDAGATADQVRSYFTGRYGDWILLDPPRRGIGWLVWLLPLGVLLTGGWLVRRTLRRRPTAEPAGDGTVTATQLRAADTLAATYPTATEQLPEHVVAALADLRAARSDAEVDPSAAAGIDDARLRLAAALHEQATTAPPARTQNVDRLPDSAAPEASHAEPEPVSSSQEADASETDPRPHRDQRNRRRHRLAVRYALPAAALLFAGLLALTLSGAIGNRPDGAVVTGTFATGAPTMAGSNMNASRLAALQQATRDRPNDPAAWLAYATALDQAGDLTGAEPAYRTALSLDPRSLAATEQYAWLLIRGGSATEALRLITPLTQQRPDDPQVVLLLGLAQRGAGDPNATVTLRRYLSLAPSSPQAAIIRGLLGQTP